MENSGYEDLISACANASPNDVRIIARTLKEENLFNEAAQTLIDAASGAGNARAVIRLIDGADGACEALLTFFESSVNLDEQSHAAAGGCCRKNGLCLASLLVILKEIRVAVTFCCTFAAKHVVTLAKTCARSDGVSNGKTIRDEQDRLLFSLRQNAEALDNLASRIVAHLVSTSYPCDPSVKVSTLTPGPTTVQRERTGDEEDENDTNDGAPSPSSPSFFTSPQRKQQIEQQQQRRALDIMRNVQDAIVSPSRYRAKEGKLASVSQPSAHMIMHNNNNNNNSLSQARLSNSDALNISPLNTADQSRSRSCMQQQQQQQQQEQQSKSKNSKEDSEDENTVDAARKLSLRLSAGRNSFFSGDGMAASGSNSIKADGQRSVNLPCDDDDDDGSGTTNNKGAENDIDIIAQAMSPNAVYRVPERKSKSSEREGNENKQRQFRQDADKENSNVGLAAATAPVAPSLGRIPKVFAPASQQARRPAPAPRSKTSQQQQQRNRKIVAEEMQRMDQEQEEEEAQQQTPHSDESVLRQRHERLARPEQTRFDDAGNVYSPPTHRMKQLTEREAKIRIREEIILARDNRLRKQRNDGNNNNVTDAWQNEQLFARPLPNTQERLDYEREAMRKQRSVFLRTPPYYIMFVVCYAMCMWLFEPPAAQGGYSTSLKILLPLLLIAIVAYPIAFCPDLIFVDVRRPSDGGNGFQDPFVVEMRRRIEMDRRRRELAERDIEAVRLQQQARADADYVRALKPIHAMYVPASHLQEQSMMQQQQQQQQQHYFMQQQFGQPYSNYYSNDYNNNNNGQQQQSQGGQSYNTGSNAQRQGASSSSSSSSLSYGNNAYNTTTTGSNNNSNNGMNNNAAMPPQRAYARYPTNGTGNSSSSNSASAVGGPGRPPPGPNKFEMCR